MYFREENHSKISSYTFNLIYEREFPSEIPIEIIPFLQELCDRELLLWYDDLDGFSWISHKKEIEVFIKEKVPKKYNSLIKNTIRQYSIQEKD